MKAIKYVTLNTKLDQMPLEEQYAWAEEQIKSYELLIKSLRKKCVEEGIAHYDTRQKISAPNKAEYIKLHGEEAWEAHKKVGEPYEVFVKHWSNKS